ncbi:MAG: 2-C-methyl-D-erythritol 4-phosphate cytidylyltransferase [Candidatus Saelkia tenebricola]|nr:2-C-methyl-D-erythritol 4-phosphate cytidylyltransferase [Candidatus Saelkia tenebricola]
MGVTFVLLAAGSGERLGAKKPKALLGVGGVPMFVYSLLQCNKVKFLSQILLVVPVGYEEEFRKVLIKYRIKNVDKIVAGGLRRVDSVYNAISAIEKSEVVFIHDAARPFVSSKLLKSLFNDVKKYSAVTPGVPVRSTLKSCRRGFVEKTLKRDGVYEIQTPQVFKIKLIKSALLNFKSKKVDFDILDDSNLVELMGKKVKISLGDSLNFKITYPDDLKLARLIVKSWK